MEVITLLAYFNTSHVTVYLVAGLFATLYVQDFNTSHVTVYLPKDETEEIDV